MPRALLSVYDKTGLATFAAGLQDLGFELISTGNTLAGLQAAGLAAVAVSEVTGFPEILGGRVKTLHPAIHGGILAKGTDEHEAELRSQEIDRIDLVVSNLYPFRETVAREGVSEDEALEQIDIGGPAMIRAAAKNHRQVAVVVDPDDYDAVLDALTSGMSAERRRQLALKAFAHTAAYDAAIVNWLQRDQELPTYLNLSLQKAQELRYGENPHQAGARYREVAATGMWDEATQHSGLPLSYLNLFDAEAAWRLVHALSPLSPVDATGSAAACVIVKHANACGAAVGADLLQAYDLAFAADPKSAFGGVVALPGVVGLQLAQQIAKNPKADVVIARGFAAEALELLKAKRKNTRLLELPPPGAKALDVRRLDGGLLVQQPDAVATGRAGWSVASRRQPSESEWRDLELANIVCAHTSSNAIVFVKDGVAVGVGAGQQSRVDSVELAANKAGERARGSSCASDAFFPFSDGVEAAAAAGVTALIQPGGSIRDAEIIAAADERDMALVMTGVRHFKH